MKYHFIGKNNKTVAENFVIAVKDNAILKK